MPYEEATAATFVATVWDFRGGVARRECEGPFWHKADIATVLVTLVTAEVGLFRHCRSTGTCLHLKRSFSREEASVTQAKPIGFLLLLSKALLTVILWFSSVQMSLAGDTVKVLYAGSLVNLMEHGIGPAFTKTTGDKFEGYSGGSNGLADQIKRKVRQGDVFISATSKVDDDLMGASNGDWVSWYIAFAQSPLVIGYNPSGRFAADLKTKPWYEVLSEPGIRIGRTDPTIDPKGALTLQLMQKAEAFYKSPDLSQHVLGAPDNSAQVLPEETLVGRLQSGQLDVGFFYSIETADAKIPAIDLPAAIAPKAVYTVTILNNAPNATGAKQFVTFLLGDEGRRVLLEHGLYGQNFEISGNQNAVPLDIRSLP
jgi:molybdate/tungstate transport system substrate-binding protein